MLKTTDPGCFFQSDASETKTAQKISKSGNKNGDPIVLRSKILSAIPDSNNSACIYVTESMGCIRKINVKTKQKLAVYRGPNAPITSVAIGAAGNSTVFGACWDKDIWSWDQESQILSKRYKGHSDFVKTIITANLGGKNILISGGADSKIMIWDTTAGVRLYHLRDVRETMMSIQDLLIDPHDSTATEIILYSASSDPFIRRWQLNLSCGKQILLDGRAESNSMQASNPGTGGTIHQHETSIYQIIFQDDNDDDDEGSNLWTASADGTAKCLSRTKNWCAEEIYEHSDYVRAVSVTENLVITAGRDENIKIWKRASGELYHVYEGHFDEVTGLILLDNQRKLVSVSIDGTIRCWELEAHELEKIKNSEERIPGGAYKEPEGPKSKVYVTAEEEAQLKELMELDDL